MIEDRKIEEEIRENDKAWKELLDRIDYADTVFVRDTVVCFHQQNIVNHEGVCGI